MTSNIYVRDSLFGDVKKLCKTMRKQDQLESLKMGYAPEVALKYSYKNALYRKTALVDGVVSAMWGVVGHATSEEGHPYFVTGEKVKDISPIRFAKLYMYETETMLQYFPRLSNYVDADYDQSVRLLQIAGYTVEPEQSNGLRPFWKEAH